MRGLICFAPRNINDRYHFLSPLHVFALEQFYIFWELCLLRAASPLIVHAVDTSTGVKLILERECGFIVDKCWGIILIKNISRSYIRGRKLLVATWRDTHERRREPSAWQSLLVQPPGVSHAPSAHLLACQHRALSTMAAHRLTARAARCPGSSQHPAPARPIPARQRCPASTQRRILLLPLL